MIYSNFDLTGCMILGLLNLSFITSPAPGEGRGDERMINPICISAPTATLDKSLSLNNPTVSTEEVAR